MMTQSRLEDWISKEVDLAQRHEELLLRREALLQGTEAYYDAQENRAASFIASFAVAEQRNNDLLDELDECIRDLKRDTADPGTPKFNSLKNNYWVMLKNVLPVWLDELHEYQRRHGGHVRALSPHPPPGSPPQGRTPRSPRPPVSPPPGVSGVTASQAGTVPRTLSPNGRPPSPGRKSAVKKSSKKSGKNSKSSKSSKTKSKK